MKPLARAFFDRPAEVVAKDLLGAMIVSTIGGCRTSGVIVETEAYLGFDDPASHAYRGRRHAGNLNLYAPPGPWYVYLSYGIHWCANLVTGNPAAGAAVLLRAVVPQEGVPVMRRRRGKAPDRHLADGPGKLCQALGITRREDGLLMSRSALRVGLVGESPAGGIVATPRVGITKAADWPLRFLRTTGSASGGRARGD
ncbi:MAG: DNA-3-methyladenine glycosylase [Gemmatimonadales bacterium]|nr:DNA-3-methyladenine glycosylase [Gemmatimonadales bacterium]